jgi:hypothetical protein
MVGNMIELKNPTASIVHIAACPPSIIDVATNAAAAMAHTASTYPALNRRNTGAPRNRPTIAPPQ